MTWHVADLDRSHHTTLGRFLSEDASYTLRVFGRPPSPDDATAVLEALPPMIEASAKTTLGLWDGNHLVAVADLVMGHPGPESAYVGLLQVSPAYRGRGAGRALHQEILRRAHACPGVTGLRLSVVATNAHLAQGFWQAMGYTPTGEITDWAREDGVMTSAQYWHRDL